MLVSAQVDSINKPSKLQIQNTTKSTENEYVIKILEDSF